MMTIVSRCLATCAVAGALALGLLTAGCGSDPTSGKETFLGLDTPLSAAAVAVAQTDVQAVIAALPTACADFAKGVALTQGEVAALQTAQVKVPASVVAGISKLSTNGQLACSGTIAVLATADGYAASSVTAAVPTATAPAAPAPATTPAAAAAPAS